MLSFEEFYKTLTGYEPFPWQSLLVEKIQIEGWPDVVCMPTAAGKTLALILGHLYRLYVSPEIEPRRLSFTVDRRVIIDEVYHQIQDVVKVLAQATSGPLYEIASRFREISGTETPVVVSMLRGGTSLGKNWSKDPAQCTIVIITVDQIGSRLLFRGYGASRKALSLQAGLLSHDNLIVLDEAHCSNPFYETTKAIIEYMKEAEICVAKPLQIVAMTATPQDTDKAFPPPELEEKCLAHPKLQQRIQAPKIAKLVGCSKDPERILAKTIINWVNTNKTPKVYAAVCNTVKNARAVTKILKSQKLNIDTVLLTGRSRPLCRDWLIRSWEEFLLASEKRKTPNRSLVIVATQCIEVGANFDFDAMVTEVCPWDSLVQRIGRVARLGLQKDPCEIVIVGGNEEDPVYGKIPKLVWDFLGTLGPVIQLSIEAIRKLDPKPKRNLCTEAPHASLLLPSHLNALVQTSPKPAQDPDLEAFLHGPDPDPPEVHLTWRTLPEDTSLWEAEVFLRKPNVSKEALNLPVTVVRNWLRGRTNQTLSDNNNNIKPFTKKEENALTKDCKPFLIWTSDPDENSVCSTNASDICPGATIVIPTNYGGCDEFGWDPDYKEIVEDIGDVARDWKTLLYLPQLLKPYFDNITDIPKNWDSDILLEMVSKLIPKRKNTYLKNLTECLRTPGGYPLVQIENNFFGFSNKNPNPVTLAKHSEDLSKKLDHFCKHLNLNPKVNNCLRNFGPSHDLGKLDSRNQKLFGWESGEPWAKSPKHSDNEAKALKKASGFPDGARHEMVSVRILEAAGAEELLLHLVGSHHGWGRPCAPIVLDTNPVIVETTIEGKKIKVSSDTKLYRFDSGLAQRFWHLIKIYGWWGLSYLEALTQLADHQASAEEDLL
jgi:CRISPR-associated endonuclease/helicase Cas3